MRRRLFNILAAVSLVLCLATAGMSASGFGDQGLGRWITNGDEVAFGFNTECVWVRRAHVGLRLHIAHGVLGFEHTWEARVRCAPAMQALASLWPPPPDVTDEYLRVPVWFVFLATATLPALWLWRYRRDRRLRSDGMPHCAKCDYNLTGNVSGICPDCGTAVPADVVRRTVL